MIKDVFKSLFPMTFVIICFSSNLFAIQQSVAEKQIDELLSLSKIEDVFVRKFAENINDSRVKYDGKTLKIYKDLRSDLSKPLIVMIGSLVLGLVCLIKSEGKYGVISQEFEVLSFLCALFGVASMGYIFINIINDILSNAKLTPFLAIDSEQIENHNKIKMKWADASIMKFLSNNSIMLCDKNGIPLFVVDTNNLTIKLSELITFLGFYLKKYGVKEKAPAFLLPGHRLF